jgi:Kip1 ubiquitination-promoting complex protein 1
MLYTGVFVSDSEDVSVKEIEDVKKMIQLLTFNRERLSEVTVVSDDELCSICYAYPISATFRPCNHQSCRYILY